MSRIDEALRRAAESTGKQGNLTIARRAREVAEMDRELHAVAREFFSPETAPPRPSVHASHDLSLAGVPHRVARMEKLVGDGDMPIGAREQYRRIASALHRAQDTHALKVVMIASAVQGEGKTLTAANLALTLSESYQRRVLLIDADLRRPRLHTLFHVSNSAGLSNLTSSEHEHLLVRQVSTRLSLLPAGPATADPMARLTSDRMQRVIDEAREDFDWVIVDTPPVVLLSDANLLSAMVDGAVLVVRAGATPHELVTRAIAALGRERILGVVLNRAEEPSHSGYGYYQYEHAPGLGRPQ